MNKALMGFLVVAVIVTGFFSGYGILYASNNNIFKFGQPEKDIINGQPAKQAEITETAAELPAGGQASVEPAKTQNKYQEPLEPGKICFVDEADLDSILILVNKEWNLSESYVPADLVPVEAEFASHVLPERRQMRREAAEALARMIEGARQEGLDIVCISGYRSYGTQKAVYEAKVRQVGEENAARYVAYPGQSEHQTGLAMDVCDRNGLANPLTTGFGETKEGQWLKENAHRFGFIIRYPKGRENITGYNYEPWHVRYVGLEAAQIIYSQDLTLEEYLANQEVNSETPGNPVSPDVTADISELPEADISVINQENTL